MKKNKKELRTEVSKITLCAGLLIETFVFFFVTFFIALFFDIGFEYLSFILFGIICVYLICRNYFFISISSAILGICWKKRKLILLKNFLYILIIVLLLQKIIILKILSGIIIDVDVFFIS